MNKKLSTILITILILGICSSWAGESHPTQPVRAQASTLLSLACLSPYAPLRAQNTTNKPTGNIPAAARAAKVASPELPRDFTLPWPLFSTDSAWNQKVTSAAVLPESNQQILTTYRVLRGNNTTLSWSSDTTWPFPFINYDDYSVPIFRTGTAQQNVLLCDYEGNLGWTNPKLSIDEEGGPVHVPAPAGGIRPAGPQDIDSDGHLVLYDPDSSIAYDYWQATTVRDSTCQSQGGGLIGTSILEAGTIDFFDVYAAGANPDTYFSARATGVPLLAGLLVPEDIEQGIIAHSLAVAIPGLRNTSTDPQMPLTSDYFYPTSTTETDFYNTHPYALAAGQRLRLRTTLVDAEGNSIDENQLSPVTRMFLEALRTYGAILVDNAGGFIFYAEDIHTAPINLNSEEINTLLGQAPGTPLPNDKTAWQLLIETINLELENIPFAYGPWEDEQDPANAQIKTANFEVVESFTTTDNSNYLPLLTKTAP